MPLTLIRRGVGYADLARQARKARSDDAVVRANAQVHLVERMGRLRGLPQKIGQIISMSGSDDQADAFAPLTDSAEPLPFATIAPILEQAWNRPIDRVVRTIDEHGLAASLGQVHRAELLDDRVVAIKVRYPDIREAVMADLKMLGWLSRPVGDLRRGFDLADYRREILRDIEAELDYRVEADHQRRFASQAGRMEGWVIPGVIDELSGENVLVTEWIDGERIEAAATWDQAERDRLALNLVRGFFRTLFGNGFIHADPHPGNYRFVQTPCGPRIVLFDYGSMAVVTREHRVAILKLIQITTDKIGDPYSLLTALGFNEKFLEPIRGKLAALCNTLFDPFRCPGKYDLARWNRRQRMDDILGDDRWNFRLSGPAQLIFVMRAFKGLTFYLERLGADVAWSIALRPWLEEHQAALAAIDVSAPAGAAGTFENFAKHLRIQVTENGQQKVALRFLGTVVDNLDEIMDDELTRRIAEQGIDLAAIVRDVRHSGYAPRELFRLEESDASKGVRVWLE